MSRCAQKGCLVPVEAEEGSLCPGCGNPLQLVSSLPEVSQEQPEAADFPQLVDQLAALLNDAGIVLASYRTLGEAPANIDVDQMLRNCDALIDEARAATAAE